jgi:AcrR family transcriptional regulator
VAVTTPDPAALDRSAARAAAQLVVEGWPDHPADEDRRGARLRAAARAEFGRRGYEATTVRDIAAAADMSTGSVYRLIGSKEQLLGSVMRSFADHITAGWEAVLASPSSAVEKLDALMWVDSNVLSRFRQEYRIQLASLRVVPDVAEDGWLYSRRLRELRTLLAQGARQGEIELRGGTADERAWCVLELIWMPEHIVAQGVRSAQALARDTVLVGASTR